MSVRKIYSEVSEKLLDINQLLNDIPFKDIDDRVVRALFGAKIEVERARSSAPMTREEKQEELMAWLEQAVCFLQTMPKGFLPGDIQDPIQAAIPSKLREIADFLEGKHETV